MMCPSLRALAVLGLATLACKDSTSTPVVDFITLPTAILDGICSRGERQVTQAIAGAVDATDCPFGDGSFYEGWRVRVAQAGSYRFAATSDFDNYLFVVRLNSFNATTAEFTTIAQDDDSGPGDNALVGAVTLQPDTDYFLFINGFDSTATGPYAVAFTRP